MTVTYHTASVDDCGKPLQELSRDDTQDLTAFQDKRRWFEGKLKFLEGLPPIYPFILPEIVAAQDDQGGFEYAEAGDSEWHLPDVEELRTWQAERDAVEEEVLAFDGGDLGRMKAKTREITLVPLTKPSTHLVEITLDLILLIDRLLTLLRHRSDLLELVRLRLQWDGLRWRVMRECRSLTEETDLYVQRESRWKPSQRTTYVGAPAAEPVTPSKHHPLLSTATPPTPSPATKKTHPAEATNGVIAAVSSWETRSPHTPVSPVSMFSPQSYPSPSLQNLSLVQSLSARQRGLISTHLKRSSAVLDRMIDLAGPLKGLGGVNGPTHHVSQEAGALPDELLDLQDDLEVMCEGVKGRVEVCKQLEEQNQRYDRYHIAMLHSRQLAENVVAHLKASLDQPATSTQHEQLSSLLQAAQESLPKPLPSSGCSNAIYPSLGEASPLIREELQAARKSVEERCEGSADGVKWYGKLVTARTGLEIADRRMQSASDELRIASSRLNDLRDLSDSTLDLLPDEPTASYSGTSDNPLEWISEIERDLPGLMDQAQASQIAIMRYNSSFNPPTSVRAEMGAVQPPDALHLEAEKRVAELMEMTRQASIAVLRAKEMLALRPFVRRLRSNLEKLELRLQEVPSSVEKAIEAAAWVRTTRRVDTDSELRCGRLQEEVRDVSQLLDSAATTLSELDRVSLQMTDLAEHIEPFRRRYEAASDGVMQTKALLDVLLRVVDQRKICDQLENEAAALLVEIDRADESSSAASSPMNLSPAKLPTPAAFATSGDSVQPPPESVRQRAKLWAADIATRLPFVAHSASALDAADDSVSEVSVLKTDLLDREPGSSQAAHGTNLTRLDQQVRSHVNELVSRVESALAHRKEFIPAPLPITARDIKELEPEGDLEHVSPPRATAANAVTEDVFGTVRKDRGDSPSPAISSDPAADQVRQLRRRLRSLRLAELSFPTTEQIAQSPILQQIPSAVRVADIAHTLDQIEQHLATLLSQLPLGEGEAGQSNQIERLRTEIGSARAYLPRLEALAGFATSASRCDDLFGRLLVDTDDIEQDGQQNVQMETSRGEGFAAVVEEARFWLESADGAAANVESDRRVAAELHRLQTTWADVSASLSPRLYSKGMIGRPAAVDAVEKESNMTTIFPNSVIASKASPITASRIPVLSARKRTPSSLSLRSNLATATNGYGGMQLSSTPASRLDKGTVIVPRRHVSIGDAGPDTSHNDANGRLSSSTNMVTRRIASASSRTVSSSARPDSSLSSRQVSGDPESGRHVSESSSSRSAADTARQRKVSLPVRLSGTAGESTRLRMSGRKVSDKSEYIADPKSPLDQAVGKIVDKLSMNVPVVPVNIAGTDDWKDQSGRYWIGAKGRAKLCFCRILRSRTVMVRVGGGWMELSRFLVDHFSDSLFQVPMEAAEPQLHRIDSDTGSTSLVSTQPTAPAPAASTMQHAAGDVLVDYPGPNDSASGVEAESSADVTGETRQDETAPVNGDHTNQPKEHPTTPIRCHQVGYSPRLSIGHGSLPKSQTRHSLAPGLSRSSSFFSPWASPSSASGATGATSGPGTPLVPLHFLRKASESPPVREREKERLQVARRSILGKEV